MSAVDYFDWLILLNKAQSRLKCQHAFGLLMFRRSGWHNDDYADVTTKGGGALPCGLDSLAVERYCLLAAVYSLRPIRLMEMTSRPRYFWAARTCLRAIVPACPLAKAAHSTPRATPHHHHYGRKTPAYAGFLLYAPRGTEGAPIFFATPHVDMHIDGSCFSRFLFQPRTSSSA